MLGTNPKTLKNPFWVQPKPKNRANSDRSERILHPQEPGGLSDRPGLRVSVIPVEPDGPVQGGFRVIDLDHNYFLVKLAGSSNYIRALACGPWIVLDHYLTVEPWQPNFELATHKTEMCVDGIWYSILYENVPQLYFEYGRIGHMMARCAATVPANFMPESNGSAIALQAWMCRPRLLILFKLSARFRGGIRRHALLLNMFSALADVAEPIATVVASPSTTLGSMGVVSGGSNSIVKVVVGNDMAKAVIEALKAGQKRRKGKAKVGEVAQPVLKWSGVLAEAVPIPVVFQANPIGRLRHLLLYRLLRAPDGGNSLSNLEVAG
ncbi:hypothetical protein Tsubulata_021000 [Turnera subulata]|uniref:DUF4283 domain-containing protein n=1 Tax=Turnera subulata TaxID=218843 RepID=A0A9Q0FAB4_9ROSI|nr:hypothetical protein Tsubulata_021000 [Turnera subulata]